MRIGLPATSVANDGRLGNTLRLVLLAASFAPLASWSVVGAADAAGQETTGKRVTGTATATVQTQARAARTVYIQETAHLHLLSEGESTLNERGSAVGTFGAPLTAHLNLSPGHVSAVFTLYPKGGTIIGRASARFLIRGSTGYYGGTLKIVRGTGTYRRAAGSNIGISGTINRNSFALTVKANGWMQL